MEKLVVVSDDGMTQEFRLIQKRISLGRDQTNDICLSDKSVSRHHASVVQIYNEYFLEDEKSTNGTRLNGLEVRKHILKHGDEIEVGKYRLRFQDEIQEQQAESDLDKTMVIQPATESKALKPKSQTPSELNSSQQARIRYLTGPDKGQEKVLDRSFFTIGKPGGDLILINRRHTGYFLLKMGGDNTPSVNGEAVKVGGRQLQKGDKIQLGELNLEFIQ